ncbi:uncharacterized protein [Penaeus vannamei]|uniref:uncharacterized protein n=1 Tax=Penaeus vannamei TaxID=6689 RepID=UPI00387F6804
MTSHKVDAHVGEAAPDEGNPSATSCFREPPPPPPPPPPLFLHRHTHIALKIKKLVPLSLQLREHNHSISLGNVHRSLIFVGVKLLTNHDVSGTSHSDASATYTAARRPLLHHKNGHDLIYIGDYLRRRCHSRVHRVIDLVHSRHVSVPDSGVTWCRGRCCIGWGSVLVPRVGRLVQSALEYEQMNKKCSRFVQRYSCDMLF